MYNQDFTVKRGENFNVDIYFKSDNNPCDLSGYTAKSQIRAFPEDENLVAEITCTVFSTEGIVHLDLSKEQTLNIPAGTYFYDLCLTKDDVNIYYLHGKFIVLKYITEPTNA